MQQQIGIGGFAQRGLECIDEFVRQVADEAHGVGQRHRALCAFKVELTRGGVQRGEKLVGRVGLRIHQGVEQRRLARIGVADQGDPKSLVALAGAALRAALALDLVEPLLHRLDALADHAAIKLDLRFTWTASIADAAALPLEVAPAPHQPGREVLQARQFDLQLAFVALCALAKNLQDQHRAVGHRHTEVPLKIALLRRRQGLIEQHRLGLMRFDQGLDLIGLARPDEECGVGCLAASNDTRDRLIAGRLGQQRQFVERCVERTVATDVDPNEDGFRQATRGRRDTGRDQGWRRRNARGAKAFRPAPALRRRGSSRHGQEPQ